MAPADTEQIFTEIYLTNAWGDSESSSGPGSTVSRTCLLRPRLQELLRDLAIRSLLDLPCGDFNWMRLVELPSIDYTGGDIVLELVRRNIALYARPGRKFVCIDMLGDALPKADLILCRDGLVHFSFPDIARALRAMKQSGSSYLLATTFTAHPVNQDIPTGSWRPLNLDIAPFWFPPARSRCSTALAPTVPTRTRCWRSTVSTICPTLRNSKQDSPCLPREAPVYSSRKPR